MRTLYIDCGMGAAGDMLTAAMLELLQVDGRVEALTYEEQQAPRGSWLTRLLG